MKKVQKTLVSSMAALASVASIIAPSAAVLAEETMTVAKAKELIANAGKVGTIYDYNVALVAIQKLPAAEQPALNGELAKFWSKCAPTEVVNVLNKMIELAAKKDLTNFYILMDQINTTVTNKVNKDYLLSELNSWGKAAVFTADVVAATDAVIKAWTSKTTADLDAARALAAKVSNAGSVNWLNAEIAKLAKVVDLQILSITATNGKDLVVQFSKEVDDVTAEDEGNYVISVNNQTALATTEYEATVDENDATKVHVVLADGEALDTGAYVSFKVKKTVLDTNLKGLAADVVKTLTFVDNTAPTVSKVEVVGNNLKVTFNDYVSNVVLAKVNGVAKTPVLEASYDKFVTITNGALDLANGTYTVQLAGVEDIANIASGGTQNVTDFTSGTFTISDSTEAPTVSKVEKVDEDTVKVTFNKAVTAPTVAVKKNGLALSTTVSSTADAKVWTVDVADNGGVLLYETNESTVTLSVAVSGYKATADNVVGDAVTKTVVVSKDTTAPTVVTRYNGIVDIDSAATYDEVIRIRFNEVIANPVTSKIILTDKDGVRQTIDRAVVVADADLNNTILEIESDAIRTTGRINSGTYTVTLGAGAVEDAAGNDVAATNVAITKSGTSASETTASAAGSGSQIIITFGNDMTSSALVVSNYKLDNKALPAGTIAYFDGNKYTVVLELPAGSIVNNDDVILTISSNVVADGGAAVQAAQRNLVVADLTDNVKPVLTAAKKLTSTTIELTFSENLAAVADNANTVNDFVVKVNGVAFTVTNVTDGTANDNKVVLTVSPYNVNQTVTVTTADSNLTVADDNNGNLLTAKTTVTATK